MCPKTESKQQIKKNIFQSSEDSGTIVPGDFGTLVPNSDSDAGTMIEHGTLVPDKEELSDVESNLGTMVINDDNDDDDEDADDETMKSESH